MASIIGREAIVRPDGTIEIRAPELRPGQRVKVMVEVEGEALAEKRHVIDIVKDLPGHRAFKTAEEVDAYIREERDSWDD
jgi:hypothetical protein